MPRIPIAEESMELVLLVCIVSFYTQQGSHLFDYTKNLDWLKFDVQFHRKDVGLD